MMLLIDNYDSFTYNLAHLFGELGAEVVVRRNDEIDEEEPERASPSHLIVSPLFSGLPGECPAGRYHSLAATRIPDSPEVTATCEEGEIMAVRHRKLPVHGVQFHPESILTPVGPALARNFLEER